MRKLLLSVFVVAIVGFSGFYAYISLQQKDAESALLLENIEALGQNEHGFSQCPGPPIYAVTGIAKERSSERRHSPDSLDYLTTYEVEYCYADGFGEMPGTNGNILNRQFVKEERVKCNGKHYSLSMP